MDNPPSRTCGALAVLVQFALRLAFGLAFAMALLSPQQVRSRFFQVHLYVLLGLHSLAAALAWLAPDRFPLWPPITGAVLCYVASVLWPHQNPRWGRAMLVVIAGVSLVAALLAAPEHDSQVAAASDGEQSAADPLASNPPQLQPRHSIPAAAITILGCLDPVTSGLLLGAGMAAMLLGHWYLNAPGMKLEPLRMLILLTVMATLLRAAVCGTGLIWQMADIPQFPPTDVALFLGLRWLAGLLAPLVLAWMTWQTLKIPNTQSATGILYVVVIVTFIGELSSQLLSAAYPLPL